LKNESSWLDSPGRIAPPCEVAPDRHRRDRELGLERGHGDAPALAQTLLDQPATLAGE
jgi:hypothetical protein